MYRALKPAAGLPAVYWCGTALGAYNVMVMELLGDSLETLYNKCSRKFSLKTVTMLAIQLLHRIEHHHTNHYLHRDIKPDNFLMGLKNNAHTLYLIDMGLCKQYREPDTLTHIPYRENKKLIGTPRYASINTHLGVEQCFPPDHRLLTKEGFKFVAAITLDDEIATFNPATQMLEYHRPTRLIKKQSTAQSGPFAMIHVKHAGAGAGGNNHIDLITTDDHDWFVKQGNETTYSRGEGKPIGQKIHWLRQSVDKKQVDVPYTKVPARALSSDSATKRFKVLTAPAEGLDADTDPADLPFVDALGLHTPDEIAAFVELYGQCTALTLLLSSLFARPDLFSLRVPLPPVRRLLAGRR